MLEYSYNLVWVKSVVQKAIHECRQNAEIFPHPLSL